MSSESEIDVESQHDSAAGLEDAPAERKSRRKAPKQRPFRFLDLPAELRRKVYLLCLELKGSTLDLHPQNRYKLAPTLNVFRVCKRVYQEAWPIFYGYNVFRLYPVDGQFFYTRQNLLHRIPPKYRRVIQTVELRLGPGWTKPPSGWNVGPRAKLKDLRSLRTVNVFVELDPSDPIFRGFRKGTDFYSEFASALLDGVLTQAPSAQTVNFDGWPSVQTEGSLMNALTNVANKHKKRIKMGTFGREQKVSAQRLADFLHNMSLGEDGESHRNRQVSSLVESIA